LFRIEFSFGWIGHFSLINIWHEIHISSQDDFFDYP
jgi:hypothetical protein